MALVPLLTPSADHSEEQSDAHDGEIESIQSWRMD